MEPVFGSGSARAPAVAPPARPWSSGTRALDLASLLRAARRQPLPWRRRRRRGQRLRHEHPGALSFVPRDRHSAAAGLMAAACGSHTAGLRPAARGAPAAGLRPVAHGLPATCGVPANSPPRAAGLLVYPENLYGPEVPAPRPVDRTLGVELGQHCLERHLARVLADRQLLPGKNRPGEVFHAGHHPQQSRQHPLVQVPVLADLVLVKSWGPVYI